MLCGVSWCHPGSCPLLCYFAMLGGKKAQHLASLFERGRLGCVKKGVPFWRACASLEAVFVVGCSTVAAIPPTMICASVQTLDSSPGREASFWRRERECLSSCSHKGQTLSGK